MNIFKSIYSKLALIALMAAAATVAWQHFSSAPVQAQRIACADLVAGCIAQTPNGPVTVGISETIRPLHAFEIWVKPSKPGKIEAEFTMVDMNMGYNLYTLRPSPDGAYRVKATLPFCISGRADWILTLRLPDAAIEVPFSTAAPD
jgi:hypothetical protein